jgi:hypothetical protein
MRRRFKIAAVALASLVLWGQVLADWDEQLGVRAVSPECDRSARPVPSPGRQPCFGGRTAEAGRA